MNFKPDEKNIRSLLKSGCQFVIPRFQREYSWDKKNYQEFFEDMINNLVASSGVINDDQYFLGTMLFVGNFAEKPDKPIEVVDGQQRLTTITILFSVLSDRFRELGEDTLSKQLFNYITTTDDNGCNLVRRTEKGRLRRRGWGLRWEKAQKGGKGTNLRGFFED